MPEHDDRIGASVLLLLAAALAAFALLTGCRVTTPVVSDSQSTIATE